MNEHIATYPRGDSISILWMTVHPSPIDELAHQQVGLPLPSARKLEMTFRRIAIGISLEPLFVTVVGERVFTHEDQTSSVYVVLDELLDTDNPSQTFTNTIRLKDQYHAQMIFCSHEPASLTESLRRLEGLSYYNPPYIEQVARTRWPSFTDFELTAAVLPREVPSAESLGSDLNNLLSETARDPRTQGDLLGADAQPIPRLLFLDDFPVYRTLQSVRTNQPAGTTALWLAIKGLETTGIPRTYTDEDLFSTSPNRNPAGY